MESFFKTLPTATHGYSFKDGVAGKRKPAQNALSSYTDPDNTHTGDHAAGRTRSSRDQHRTDTQNVLKEASRTATRVT